MSKAKKISDLLKVDEEKLKQFNILNVNLERDYRYYINLKLLEKTTNPFFLESYDKIIKRFEQIYRFLENSKDENDRFFEAAMSAFCFPEMNELCIGLADGKYGKGLTSEKLRKETLKRAKELIQEGKCDSNIFLFIGILHDGIGFDFISDMIGNIIKEDIENFTKHVNEILRIETRDGFVINPIKNRRIYYLPMDILSSIPILGWMTDIDVTISENSDLRMFVNKAVGEKWKELSSRSKKDLFIKSLKEDNKIYNDLVDKYINENVDAYNFDVDPIGDVLMDKAICLFDPPQNITIENIEKLPIMLCDWFKQIVENNRGSHLLYVDGKIRHESYAQILFHIVGLTYLLNTNLDISPEVDSGRGPLDFKVSAGKKIKFLIELKKLSSKQLYHGLQTQINEYGKAEMNLNYTYLVLDDMDESPSKDERLEKLYKLKNDSPFDVNVIIVDVKPRASASIYEEDSRNECSN